ncbi:MAG: asparagine synthase (glutamine-hydrolyzing), partial [Syntrophobacteraceae bacterium]
MCGIAGFFHFGGTTPGDASALLARMASIMAHRGPDGEGFYLDDKVGLAHRRLSIIDLDTGAQPMSSPDGRLHVVFNGEIYNHLDLRNELGGFPFRTRSDTEVLLAAYDRWGADFPGRLNGIFAFALWDAALRRLILCRDPFGVKPLHIHANGARLAFASEIKSLLVLPGVRPQVNRQALHDFMNVRYVPGTATLFAGIQRLEPGHLLVADESGTKKLRYFDLRPAPVEAVDEAQWCERIVDASRTAVKRQLMSDVPLGVYLSGGMDSSTIVAMMRDLGVPEIMTFSLGFNEPTDELDDAAVVAEHFGTRHFPMIIDPKPLQLMDEVLWHVEEPQVNMLQGYYIAKHASRHVKVVLGGLGGDELFAGYINNIYLKYAAPWHRLTPGALQRTILAPLSRAVYRTGARLDLKWDEYRRGIQLLCASGAPARYYSILRNVWDHDPEAARTLYGERMLSMPFEPAGRHFEPFFRTGPRSDILGDSLWLELNS